ncbi:Mu transposase C-terminal domain-containing protein [Candidatus Enterococcus ikei]|uniref:DDE-type integrase/transposase/recombinase n=1 Tax=Candidatus Enterococcus ikei TaxID=2815326 RepID=A0ABS3H2C9_9ENTE|nr:Mu transposase C-terminal domain-containing protein [Enterococcus sp. DIV0869a]MBO0441694.1 DDE-type integrase/transposase/recombinase [Enterococcus sp. DIV0869a]
MNNFKPLSYFTDSQRESAEKKYKIIEPNILNDHPLSLISSDTGIPLRTLYRWKEKYNTKGLKGLIRQKRSDLGEIKVENHIKSLIKNSRLSNRRISIATIHRKIISQCERQDLTAPSYQQVYKIVKELPDSMIELAHNGQKLYSEKYDLVYTRESKRPNEIWQADHTLLDIEVLDEKNRICRPWLSIIIDDYSRAIAGYYISFKNPSAINTALMLYQAIWRKENPKWPVCGIPEKFYTDHGSDFTSKQLEQVAIDLKMQLIFSKIGVPRGRGKIERFFQSVNQLLLENLPGYIKNRKSESLLTIQELERKLEEFLIYNYNHRIHTSIQETPVNLWNASGFLPQMPDTLEDLDLLLLYISKARKVHSDGIYFQGFRYINSNLSAYVGESVQIRYNPKDLAEIRVFFQNKYLCTAIAPDLSNFTVDLNDIVAARNKRRRQLKKESIEINSVAQTVIEDKMSELTVKSEKSNKSKIKRYFND